MKQAEFASGKGALRHSSKWHGDRLAHSHAGNVGEEAVGKALKLDFATGRETDQRIFGTAESRGKGALGRRGRILAFGNLVLEEARGTVGPGLA
jgi:hypothetical protein